jgi:hypothetical protein
MIHAHMRAVERFDYHPVNAQWCYGLAPPDGLLPDRGETERQQRIFLKHELFQEKVCELQGNCCFCATLFLYAIAFRYAAECFFVPDHVISNSAFCCLFQKEDEMTAVIGVGSRSPGDLAEKIACHNRIRIGPADAAGSLIRNPAWPHVTDPAAEAFGSEAAGTLLGIQTGEAGIDAIPLRLDQCFQRRLVPYTILRFYYFFGHQ